MRASNSIFRMPHPGSIAGMVLLFFTAFTLSLYSQSEVFVANFYDITSDPIPVKNSAPDNVNRAVIRVNLTNPPGGAGDTTIDVINITRTGTVDFSEIAAAKVYVTGTGGGDKFNPGSPPSPAYTCTVGGTDPNITLTTTGSPTIPDDDTMSLWIAFDYNADDYTTDTSTVGYDLASITMSDGSIAVGQGVSTGIHNFIVTFDAEGIVQNPEEAQGTAEIPVLKMIFGTPGDQAVTKEISQIVLTSLGADDADVETVDLYLDDGNGVFDDVDTETLLLNTSVAGGQATFTPLPLDPNFQFTDTPKVYFVLATVSQTATVGNTLGFEISDPSADISFNDLVDEPGTHYSGQYDHAGYIDSSFTEPGTGTNTFDIIEFEDVDVTPPTVSYTDPTDGSKNIAVDTDIVVVFDDALDSATVINDNFELKKSGGDVVSGALVLSSANTMTFTPDTSLDFSAGYTATVKTGIKDDWGNQLTAEQSWTFTTFPDVDKPMATNNRIVPGGNQTVLIFVTEPPKGAKDRITVQVFTATGRRVATLVNAEPYENLASKLPLRWDGTNGRGEKLGPGLYFIQIRATDFKRVLRAMIVR